jgi:membrane protein required for colicin V production
MHWLDIVLIIILAISLFHGWWHGLLHLASEFVAFVLAIFVARLFYSPLADRMGFIQTSEVAEIVAFSILCVIVFIVIAVLFHITVEPRIKRAISSRVNRGGGMVLGFIFGAAFSVIIVLLLNKFVVSPPWSLDESSGIRQCITTALDDSFFAGIIIKCFGCLF